MKQEPTTYQPKEIEKKIYEICFHRGYFEINGNEKIQEKNKRFCLMMPPPNVTGILHIGHALTLSLQDILARYKRMDGYKTLYQPGLDHAGIATQNVVEKQLLSQGIKKEDLGREAFVQKVWEWKEKSGGAILEQMKRLGVSAAFSRTRFTMDKGLQRAVKLAFLKWYEKGLIIQDNYMVNWCTKDGALSDIEVEYEERKGALYYIRYYLENQKDYLVVATTRPETLFGDSALMVNPNDERYKHLVGQKVILPLIHRTIPIIADLHVEMEFGTGCVKVTPGHDFNDYEVGKRHHLEAIKIFDEKGILNAHCGEFENLERLEARDRVVEKLKENALLEKIEEHAHQVGHCYRCHNVVEPYVSKQWFVKPEIAQSSIEKIQQGLARFYPSNWINNYNAWMRELRPWCISRQLFWGHQIPVFTCENNHQFVSLDTPLSCPTCKSEKLEQDKDVLDTWFSSGLWAFSTLGWGQEKNGLFNENDLKDFYPNTTLITGFDILFFWVARMLFCSESLLGELPFKDIYLHALVRDEKGEKMSKSKGNVIDPLEMIEKYGADSLRFTLANLCATGRDIKLSTTHLENNKNFANKIFNAVSYLKLKQESFKDRERLSEYQTPLGRYAKSRLNLVTKEIRNALDNYRFNDATTLLYRFLWGEFCDWFIEFSKVENGAVDELGSVLKEALKLLHPFMPFISEFLYHKLSDTELENTCSIMIIPYPKDLARDEKLEHEFEVIKDCIVSLRRLKIMLETPPIVLKEASVGLREKIENTERLQTYAQKLAKLEKVSVIALKPLKSVSDVGEFCQTYADLENLDLSPLVARLKKQLEKLEKEKLKLNLHNENFVKNAPKSVLEKAKESLKTLLEKESKIKQELDLLEQP
ncbi:valine--tRNA ligase [Helicobacter pylori]|nr:valine--tRNA ligase [Helicobacter pylori]